MQNKIYTLNSSDFIDTSVKGFLVEVCKLFPIVFFWDIVLTPQFGLQLRCSLNALHSKYQSAQPT